MARLPAPWARTRPRLEIIPFIDVMFFLLATFMMVSLTMIDNAGVEVKLPKMGAAKKTGSQPDELTITVSRGGEIFANRDPLTLAQLKQHLADWHRVVPDGRLILQGDYACEFGKIAEVLDAARALGIERLLIRAEKPAAP